MPRRVGAFVLFIAFVQYSCETPAAVSKFCSSAAAALQSGDSLFDDLKGSCIREAQTREPFGTFALSSSTPAACEDIGKQGEALKDAARILVKYYTALNNLAAFGVSKNEDAKTLLSDAAAQGKLKTSMQKSLGAIAGFLSTAATSGFRQQHLANDVTAVRDDVDAVLTGLGEAIGAVYLEELQFEEQSTALRYKEFLAAHPGGGDAVLFLDARWQSDRAMFDAKRKAAQSYQKAIEAAAKGNREMAAHAHNLRTKDLFSLLSSCTSQLDNLVPVIRRAFF